MVGVGQIGIGYWGWNILRTLRRIPDVTIVGVCDQRRDVVERVRELVPSTTIFETFEQLLANPDVEAVAIATDSPQHYEMTRMALEAGKHVFVEKPMTERVDQAHDLVSMSEDFGRHVMVGHILIYHPAYTYVENLIDQGHLGDLYYLYSVRVNLGIVRTRENAFESLGPHDIAAAIQMTKRHPVAVSATGSAYLQPQVEDVCFATIHFDDGVLAHLHCSWLDPNKVRRLTVVGSQRMAVIDDQESREKVRLYDRDMTTEPQEKSYSDFAGSISVQSGDIIAPRIDKTEPLLLELRHFIDCVVSGATPKTDARNGLSVVRVLEAARQSLKNGGITIEL